MPQDIRPKPRTQSDTPKAIPSKAIHLKLMLKTYAQNIRPKHTPKTHAQSIRPKHMPKAYPERIRPKYPPKAVDVKMLSANI